MVFAKFFEILRGALRLEPKRHRKKSKKKQKVSRVHKATHRRRNSTVRSKLRRKKAARRIKKKSPLKKKTPQKKRTFPLLGVITHYYPKVNAAVVKLKKPLSVGQPVWVKGKVTDFRQTVGSIQIDRKPIEKARAGQEIGLEVFKEVRAGDAVYLSV